jgi:hypothetical protein
MLAAAAASASAASSHPAVAVLLGLGAVAVAVATVAMAWSVHAKQIQLAETLARRQYSFVSAAAAPGTAPPDAAADGQDHGENGANGTAAPAGPAGAPGAQAAPAPAPVVIDGPDTLITGDQGRYRVRRAGNRQVMSWAVGGGAVSQAPDPAHPDELLLVADRPGSLTITVRVRDGLTERRATKAVTATPEPPAPAPPVMLRIFLHGWTLSALGNLSSADFIALVSPLAALLGVVAAVRGLADPDRGPGTGRPTRGSRSGD